jgi:hypothetical protein
MGKMRTEMTAQLAHMKSKLSIMPALTFILDCELELPSCMGRSSEKSLKKQVCHEEKNLYNFSHDSHCWRNRDEPIEL